MQRFHSGAIYNSDLREQELEKQRRVAKLMGLARMAVAATAIVSGAAYWQERIEHIALGPPTATEKVNQTIAANDTTNTRIAASTHDTKTAPVATPYRLNAPTSTPGGIGLQANLDDAFRTNKDLRRHFARSIAKEFKVPERTATQIVDGAVNASNQYNVKTTVILGLIEKESSFKTTAISSVGAAGLTQVREEYHPNVLKKVGVRGDLVDAGPSEQIHAGVAVLNSYRKEGEPLRNALVRYNVGPNAKDKTRGIVYAKLVEQNAAKWRAEAVTFLQEQQAPQSHSTAPNL